MFEKNGKPGFNPLDNIEAPPVLIPLQKIKRYPTSTSLKLVYFKYVNQSIHKLKHARV